MSKDCNIVVQNMKNLAEENHNLSTLKNRPLEREDKIKQITSDTSAQALLTTQEDSQVKQGQSRGGGRG